MRRKKAKLEMETLGKILLLTAFLVIFLVLFKGCKDSFEEVGVAGVKEYLCWGTNMIKSEGIRFFPSTCSPTIIDKEKTLEMEEISDLIRRCWWMWGKGELDLKTGVETGVLKSVTDVAKKPIDVVFTCYAFKPKEDIPLVKLRDYMQSHSLKGEQAPIKDSTWAYVQKGTKEENSICFDNEKFKGTEGIMKAGKTYYINFYDERGIWFTEGYRDSIMISTSSRFGTTQTGPTGWFKDFFKTWCYNLEEQKKS